MLFAVAPAAADGDAASREIPALPFAIAGSGCTQEDIPALEIILTVNAWNKADPPPRPYLRIEVAGIVLGAPSTLALSPLRRDPSQRIVARAELYGYEGGGVWLSGTLRLGPVSPGHTVEGAYSFCQDSDRCAEGKFKALWRPGAARCG